MKTPIIGGWGVARSTNAADSELYNLFPEVIETKDGKAPGWLQMAPGLDGIALIPGGGPIRGLHVLGDTLFAVSGKEVYSQEPNGPQGHLGSISIDLNPVLMIDNSRQIALFDGFSAYSMPGGQPLTGGGIGGNPENFIVGDQILLTPDGGAIANATPIVTVTSVSNQAVTGYALSAAGVGYAVGDTGLITTDSRNAHYLVTATDAAGAVTGVSVPHPGTLYTSRTLATTSPGGHQQGNGIGLCLAITCSTSPGPITGSAVATAGGTVYTSGTGVATTRSGQQPGSGVGLKLNITASSGPISASSISSGGNNYAIRDTGLVSGGSGDAQYQITAVGVSGVVTGITITQAGALNQPATSFSQLSTTGAGSGFKLISPSFGAFVGLVPLTMPFPSSNNRAYGPITGTVIDGFGLVAQSGTQQIWQSRYLDLSVWPAINFAFASQSPDGIVALHGLHDELFVLKQQSTEIWADAGLSPFAFQPLAGVHLEVGCFAPFSVATAGETMIFLSQNKEGQGMVVQISGYTVNTISTEQLLSQFITYSNLADAIGYSYQQGGHVFYVLTFPEADKTWVYDLVASGLAKAPLWHRRAEFLNGEWHRHWGNAFARWSSPLSPGLGALGDYRNGNVYAFNLDTLTDNGSKRRWLRTWRAMDKPKETTTRFGQLRIDMETGVREPAFSNPYVILRWSDDGGHVWSNERYASAGPPGKTATNVRFTRIGSTRRYSRTDRIFELSSTDQFRVAIIGADLEVDE